MITPDTVLSMGQIEVNNVLCKTESFEMGLFWHLNSILFLKWIVWYTNVFDIETVLMLNWIVWNRTVLIFHGVNEKPILTELFEIELFICIELICH